ncbi:hypothetical protein [Marinicauda sp. Alg238-R41]|uniref:hypothetical protein n=1 Tax=Marinicauda sp. Alg238-R41 TaxID=2993447 RepID=UPI0022E5ADD9|nr:hypothetical protein [Marinicauda sp. Alg238-R41]
MNDGEFYCEAESATERFRGMALSRKSYRELGLRNLGGEYGIFICSERKDDSRAGFDVLAKAAGPDEAERIVKALSALDQGEG